MPSFGQDFLRGFTQVSNLRDFTHASKTFTTNAWELKPRFKFLFHVVFSINVDQIYGIKNAKVFSPENVQNLSLAVKTVDLPKYSIDTTALNQYNRTRMVQTKIHYDPVTITFHDDSGDNIREMWYQYYNYYYKDPSYKYVGNAPVTNGSIGQSDVKDNGFNYNARDIYAQNRSGGVSDWGYIGESYADGTSSTSGKPPFFKDIQIYGFDQHKYAQYILVNPVITNFNHDQYSYAEGGGTMQNTMTIKYETVKYLHGGLGAKGKDKNVTWPITSHYDTQSSPLSRPGSNASIFGQGGLVETGEGILEDLQKNSVMGLIGAAQKAGTAINTWKGKDIKSIAKNEVNSLGVQAVQQLGPNAARQAINKADGWVFPKAKTPPGT
jgi:hypothetical protein